MSRRAGLTLVEMLVALAIVGALLAATLRVTAGLARSGGGIRARRETSTLETGLANLLAADIPHAYRYSTASGGLRLESYASLDTGTLEIRHLPATVSYEVRTIEDHGWLVRTQRVGSEPAHTELVCPDVTRIALAGGGNEAPSRGKWKAMPPVADVTVQFEDSGQDELRFRFRRE